MRVFLDNTPLTVERPTIAGALRAGCRAAEAARRIVVEATLDGQAIPGDELLNPPDRELGDAEIRLTSAEPRSLVSTTLLDVADLLPGAQAEQRAAADAIHDGKLQDALTHLGDALRSWDQLRQVVENGARLLDLSLADLRLGPADKAGQTPTVSSRAGALGAQLAEVKRSIQAGDWTGLADVLAYELDGQAEAWRGVLTDLAAKVRSEPGPVG